MSKDISTPLTKERNKKEGRHGYAWWKMEKITVISPKTYGEFLNKRKRGK